MSRIKKWYERWQTLSVGQRNLETILFNTPTVVDSHRQRRSWMLDILDWIQAPTLLAIDQRLDQLLKSLQKSENFKQNFVQAVQHYFLKSDAVELLVKTGVPNHAGFITELVERMHFRFLPQPPQDFDLSLAVVEGFAHKPVRNWLKKMDRETFRQFFEMLSSAELKNHFHRQIEDAIYLLSINVRASGLLPPIRERLTQKELRKISFFMLGDYAHDFLGHSQEAGKAEEVLTAIQDCQTSLKDVYNHLNEFGVSVSIVYELDRIELQLKRMTLLVQLLKESNVEHVHRLLGTLVQDMERSRSLGALFSQNLSLLSKKISDRTAQTGDHYITRTRDEQQEYLRRALGGGFITGFTTMIKFWIVMMPLAPFLIGLGASLNYAISFIVIQLFGFTLATKQPSMTASALAAKMEDLEDLKGLNNLVDEIVHLVRSQVIGIFGNMLSVIPTVFVLDLFGLLVFHRHLIDQDHAAHSMESVTFLGPAAFYAIFTGAVLFASSQVGGWIDNWWVFRKMSAALRHNRKLQFVFGESAAARVALFFGQNIGGFASNFSLGLFLGLLPVVFQFFGIPLDIRHVTLSTGMITAAIFSLGIDSLWSWEFFWVFLGILGIGFCNVTSAFFCSMFVALRARDVEASQRSRIYRLFWRKVFKRPQRLFWV